MGIYAGGAAPARSLSLESLAVRPCPDPAVTEAEYVRSWPDSAAAKSDQPLISVTSSRILLVGDKTGRFVTEAGTNLVTFENRPKVKQDKA